MKHLFQEGALRPLCSSVPKNQHFWPFAALVSYPLAHFYTRCILFGWSGMLTEPGLCPRGGAMVLFALLFLAAVEAAARACSCPAAKETPLWAACWLVLSASLAVQGHFWFLSMMQELVWHLLAVWFVLARCGMLAQGCTGVLAPLDALAGCFTLPFGSFFARLRTVFAAACSLAGRRIGARKWLATLGTLMLTVALCSIAAGQLAAADAHFAALGTRLAALWKDLLTDRLMEFAFYFVLSLPVGAWLFGLVSGAARRGAPPCDALAFYKVLAPLRRLPQLTCCIVTGALSALYGLFFALQLTEWTAALGGPGLTAPQASAFAVDGFWELLRIQLLDLAVLAGVHFLAKRPLPKPLAALFCGFGIAFALLAGAKLAVYIRLFGLTPRRVAAGWFLTVLLVWGVLLLVRVFRPIPAARIGVVVLAVSFVALGCADLDRRIADTTVTRWERGIDPMLDTGVLTACGATSYSGEEKAALRVAITRRLVQDGWFVDRDIYDIYELYSYSFNESDQTVYTTQLDATHTLHLTMQGDTCTAAVLLPA